jgi:hypothetical protein
LLLDLEVIKPPIVKCLSTQEFAIVLFKQTKNVIVSPVLEKLVIFVREATLEIPIFYYYLFISSQKIRIGPINQFFFKD